MLRSPEEFVWKVTAVEKDPDSKIIPSFWHVRTVHIDATNCLLCSCYHYERCAYPCRHQSAVIRAEAPAYPGFSHHDCGLQWWKKFVHHGMRECEKTRSLDTVLGDIILNDVTGPRVPETIAQMEWTTNQPGLQGLSIDEHEYKRKFEERDPLQMCKNYHEECLQRALNLYASISKKNGVLTEIDNVGFLTQESHISVSQLPSPFGGDRIEFEDIISDGNGINDKFSDDEDNEQNNPIFESTIYEQLKEGHSDNPAQAAIDKIDREDKELKQLLRSGNYHPSMFDARSFIKLIRDAQLSIKQKMKTQLNLDPTAEWVSCCTQRTKKTKKDSMRQNFFKENALNII